MSRRFDVGGPVRSNFGKSDAGLDEKDTRMSIDRPTKASVSPDCARATSTPAPEPVAHRLRNSEPEPVDWNAAVRASGVLLHEQFGSPGSIGDPAVADMVHDLAARLCAYDEITRAVDHMQAQADPPPVKK
jgi:hypothetical protein